MVILSWSDFPKQNQDEFIGVLHLSESDANCSSSTKDVLKLIKDFLEEPLEKNSDSDVVCLPPHADFLVEFLTQRFLECEY